MTTCDDSTVYSTVGHDDVTGFYAYRDLYDEDFLRTPCNGTTVCGMGKEGEVAERSRDDIALKIYFSTCDGQRPNCALLGYLCACSQNFDFTAGNGIYFYNLLRTTLDDAVINDSRRKDTLSIDLNISKFILLWTASIIMIAAFALCLSTTTSTTVKVGVKGISVEICM